MHSMSKLKVPHPVKMGIASNLPYFLFSLLYIMSANVFQADHIRSKGIYWKLDSLEDRVISIDRFRNDVNVSNDTMEASGQLQPQQDKVFEALLSTNMKNGIWTKHETPSHCTDDAIGYECNRTMFNIPDLSLGLGVR